MVVSFVLVTWMINSRVIFCGEIWCRLWQSLLVVKWLLLGCTVWPKKIPISLVLVLVFMVFVMLFLHIDYHLYYFFPLFDNCSMYQAGKGVWICWNEVKLLAYVIIIFLRCFPFWQTVFEHLAGLLGVLITLDEIMDASHTLKEHWKQYRR